MRVLVVKLSSLGDVVHAMPALTDMLRAMPALQVDWLVEQPFAAIPALHPGVQRVLPLSWRKWRQQLTQGKTWSAMRSLRAQLREASTRATSTATWSCWRGPTSSATAPPGWC